MKRLSITALAVAAVGFSGVALADAEIFSPKADEFVYNNAFRVFASEDTTQYTDTTRTLRVRIRNIGCDADTQSSGDNVRSLNAAFLGGTFDYTFDLTGLASGEYCLVYNSLWNSAGQADGYGDRVLTPFTIVDTYAKVGGTIQMGEAGRGYSPTHAFDGVIGTVGSEIVGSILVNYRMLGEYCSLTPQSTVKIGETAPGIGVIAPVRANGLFDNSCGGTADVWILGKDNGLFDSYGELRYPRGAIVIWDTVDGGKYDIDFNPAIASPFYNWFPMARGNNVVGARN